MKRDLFAFLLIVLLSMPLYGQSINNTISGSGTFNIKDGSGTMFTLSRTSGYLYFPATTSAAAGVIYLGGNSFIHSYAPPGVGGGNTFVGMTSGNFSMSGTGSQASYNTAVGGNSLAALTTGYENSAFGTNALSSCLSGYDNCAFGMGALQYCTGNSNSAFGAFAGASLSYGLNNTLIGNGADVSAYNISNEITLGNSSVTALRCKVTSITSLSDARDKKNVRDLTLGIDFLMKVKPRLFNWDRRDWYADGKPDGSKMQEKPTAGFVAQELDEAQTKANAEWLNLVLKSNPDRLEATSGNLLPIMVKAIQELKAENDALKGEVVTLRSTIADVRKEVTAALQKSAQQEDAKTKVSLNETKN
jgi:hypothetical protein